MRRTRHHDERSGTELTRQRLTAVEEVRHVERTDGHESGHVQ